MARRLFGCWLLGCLQLGRLWALQAMSVEALARQSSIYYQQAVGEVGLEQVAPLQAVDSLKLIVHGFLGSRSHGSIMPLRNAYRAQGYENILVADWSPAANLDYPSSRRAVGRVALVLGQQLAQFLAKHNVSRAAVHIIGHSLGAHIAGRMGRYFNGTMGRVTGLDPALPLFTPRSQDGLRATAAQFVDVIHTDYPVFGDLTPRGHADFYASFGRTPQPGCEEVDLLAASKLILEAYSCSHNRAVLFYAESIGLPKNFPSIPCSWQVIRSSSSGSSSSTCLQSLPLNSTVLVEAVGNMDDELIVYMGEQVTHSATSYYYLETNAAPPFGQGVRAKFG